MTKPYLTNEDELDWKTTAGAYMTSKRVECDLWVLRGKLRVNLECGFAQPSLFLVLLNIQYC